MQLFDEGGTYAKGRALISSPVYDNTLNISTGSTTVTFSLPTNFGFSFGCYIRKAWPVDTWTGGPVVCILYDYTVVGTGKAILGTNVAQRYNFVLNLLWRTATS